MSLIIFKPKKKGNKLLNLFKVELTASTRKTQNTSNEKNK